MGHERQFVADPAAVGLRVRLKYWRAPEELIVFGICGGSRVFGGGEQRSQRSRSMSWHDFVKREGAVVDSFRQFPLYSLDASTDILKRNGNVPDVTMCEMPPSNWFCMIDR